MRAVLIALLHFSLSFLGSRRSAAFEIVALRHQLAVLQRQTKRPHLTSSDRMLCRGPPSRTWRTFLENHLDCTVGMDLLVVVTATFRILYVLVIISHERRRVVYFNVTSSPSAD
jgi:hypothetical protein